LKAQPIFRSARVAGVVFDMVPLLRRHVPTVQIANSGAVE
jgi:hypothetical protein